MKGKSEEFDDFMKSQLEDFKQTPSVDNWDQIRENIQDENIDNYFQSLAHHKVTPPNYNWNKIKQRLPFRIIYRQQIRIISRVAAVFIFACFLPQIISYSTKNNQSIRAEVVEQIKAPTFGEVVEKAVEEDRSSVVPQRNRSHRVIPQPNESAQLLATILADEQDFPDSLLDIQKLHNILQPIQPLPVISAVARVETLPITRLRVQRIRPENIELNISIPLNFN